MNLDNELARYPKLRSNPLPKTTSTLAPIILFQFKTLSSKLKSQKSVMWVYALYKCHIYKATIVHTGSCLCQAVKYSIDDELKACVNCYCQFCRKAHGSEFVTVAFAQISKLNILEGKERISEYPIEKLGSLRCFCSTCGTRLYNKAPAVGMLSLITATLECSDELKPLANINLESKGSKTEPESNLPNFDSSPNGEELMALLRE